MYNFIEDNLAVTFVFVAPVINPFDLAEFKSNAEEYAQKNVEAKGYLDDFVISNDDRIIASTSEKDERVNEQHLMKLKEIQPSRVTLFVNQGVNSHSDYFPKMMTDEVHKMCGGK